MMMPAMKNSQLNKFWQQPAANYFAAGLPGYYHFMFTSGDRTLTSSLDRT